MDGIIYNIILDFHWDRIFLKSRPKIKELLNNLEIHNVIYWKYQQQETAYVVSKHVLDQSGSIWWDYFVKDSLFIVFTGLFKLLLNEAGAILVSTELNDMAKNILSDLLNRKITR